jgi:hypothetical protein
MPVLQVRYLGLPPSDSLGKLDLRPAQRKPTFPNFFAESHLQFAHGAHRVRMYRIYPFESNRPPAIERAWIWPQPHGWGCLTVIQEKTGRQVRHRLRPETIRAIDACCAVGGDRRPIWAGFVSRRRFFPGFKCLVKAAGLSVGTSKYIRRGSASEVERIRPGAAPAHLGHRTPEMFTRAYRVERIVGKDLPMPPAIG